MPYTKQQKQQHLDNWRNSGLSQSAYCRENNLKLATFHYWKIQADK
ncbi:IS66 family insertion sequence element accessory protein TnpA, partial [Serratia microhaemolytica]